MKFVVDTLYVGFAKRKLSSWREQSRFVIGAHGIQTGVNLIVWRLFCLLHPAHYFLCELIGTKWFCYKILGSSLKRIFFAANVI
jgi:hypothetical protein